jgi:hypothetical protein
MSLDSHDHNYNDEQAHAHHRAERRETVDDATPDDGNTPPTIPVPTTEAVRHEPSPSLAMLTVALVSAMRDWLVFQCEPCGEKPMTPRWHEDATSDRAEIKRLWAVNPEANVAVACAASGLVVLEIDKPNGGNETVASLSTQLGKLPKTFEVRTGDGQRQLYFQADATMRFKEELGPNVKIKHDYVLAPLSIHPSGNRNRWVTGSDEVKDGKPAKLPRKWLKAMLEPKPLPTKKVCNAEHFVVTALERKLLERLREASAKISDALLDVLAIAAGAGYGADKLQATRRNGSERSQAVIEDSGQSEDKPTPTVDPSIPSLGSRVGTPRPLASGHASIRHADPDFPDDLEDLQPESATSPQLRYDGGTDDETESERRFMDLIR